MIRAAVRAWGARARADEVELAADELITNALMHTDGAAIVTIRVLTGSDAGCGSRSRTPPARCRAAGTRASPACPGAACCWWTGSPTRGEWSPAAPASACGANSSFPSANDGSGGGAGPVGGAGDSTGQ